MSVSVRAIVVKVPSSNWKKILTDEINGANRKIMAEVLLDFELSTATWQHQVKFVPKIFHLPKAIGFSVTTKDEIYGYVNFGTRPHPIRPKGPWPLRFQAGYKAKTSVGRYTSTVGGSFGPMVAAKAVQHPGTKARRFDQIIKKRWEKTWKLRMKQAVARGVKAMQKGLK